MAFDWNSYLGNTLSDFGYAASQGGGLGDTLGLATQRMQELAPGRQAERKAMAAQNATVNFLQAKDPELAEMVKAGTLTAGDAFNAYSQKQWQQQQAATEQQRWEANMAFQRDQMNQPSASYQTFLDSQRNPAYGDWLARDDKSAVNYSTQPQWAKDANGNYVSYQIGDDGRAQITQMPEGLTQVGPAEMAGAKAGATIDAKTQANAAAALPAAQNTASQTLATIEALRSDEQGLEETFGKVGGVWPQQMSPTLPNTAKADFGVMIDQAKGQAFLQAREMLRGGGQITDYEGQRAENAIARLSTAQSKEAFLQALDDFEAAVRDGYSKIEMAAQGQSAPQMMSAPPVGAGSDLMTKYGLE